MDWTNERYVRLYTRDTKTWLLLGWEGQMVLCFLLRKVDRSGLLEDASDGDDLSVVFANGLPKDIAQKGLDRLVSKKVVEITPDGILMPKYIEAQEASKSNPLRQKECRERRRIGVMKQPKDRLGFVYFVQSENGGPIKIGFAIDVQSRISNLQTGRHDKINTLAVGEGTQECEFELHSIFAESNVGGEWFSSSPLLEKLIGEIKKSGIINNIVTARYGIATGRDYLSHLVTPRNTVSQDVTPTCAVLCCADPVPSLTSLRSVDMGIGGSSGDHDPYQLSVFTSEDHEKTKDNGRSISGTAAKAPRRRDVESAKTDGSRVWDAYSEAYTARYGVAPARSSQSNSLCKRLCERIPAVDARLLAGYYPTINSNPYAQSGHSLALLLRDAQKLLTECVTGRRITAAQARESDRLQGQGDVWVNVAERMKREGRLEEE